jgi:hypothetical protein|tara:strand:+ start:9325 stop:9531 length:207 start_codon:yes stop_codon:yes gene_type:complete
MKLVVNNTLKPFVNNPELYNPFLEEIGERIIMSQIALEQSREPDEMFRLQGEIRALRSLVRLRDKVNG